MVISREFLTGVAEREAQVRRGMFLAGLPRTLTAEEANIEFDFDTPLEEGWSLKLFPDEAVEEGFSYSFVDPEGWELLPDDTRISPTGEKYSNIVWENGEAIDYTVTTPEGETFTLAEMRALPVEPEVPVEVEPTLTEDYALIYANYQRTGGTLGIEDWISAGTPLIPALEVSVEEQEARIAETISSVFPDMTPEKFSEFITEDWEGFESRLREGGYTEESVALLKQMGYSPTDVAEFYKVTEPESFSISPQGINYTVEVEGQPVDLFIVPDFEYVGTELKLRSDDYLVFHEDKRVGRIDPETGELIIEDPGFWGREAYPSLLERMYQFQTGRVSAEAFPEPLKTMAKISRWLYEPKQITEDISISPASVLSLVGLVGIIVTTAPVLLANFNLILQSKLPTIYRHLPGATLRGFPPPPKGVATTRVELQLYKAYQRTAIYRDWQMLVKRANIKPTSAYYKAIDGRFFEAYRLHIAGHTESAQNIINQIRYGISRFPGTAPTGREIVPYVPTVAPPVTPVPPAVPVTPVPPTALVPVVTSAAVGLPLATTQAITNLADRVATGVLAVAQITPAFIVSQVPNLVKTTSLTTQLKDLGHTEVAITAMTPQEAWANLFKAPVAVIPPAVVTPAITPEVAPTPVVEPAVPEVIPRTLPLEQVSELETRAPLDLIRKDEGAGIERLTKEIQAEGITEPITIRVREDGSQIVWDGLHRLIVAQDLGLENIPVKYIGEVQMLKPPAVEVAKVSVRPYDAEAIRKLQKGRGAMAHSLTEFVTPENLARRAMYEAQLAAYGERYGDIALAQRDVESARVINEREFGGARNTEAIRAIQKAEEAIAQVVPKPPAVEVAKPPALPAVTEEIIGLPPTTEPISQGVAENTQGIAEITAKEEVRPARKVFTKMGIWRDFYKPMQKAEVLVNEEKQVFDKARREISKLIGKDTERQALVWDEVNEKGSVVGLTFDEKRAVTRIREWADRWADRKNLPQSKRVKDYIPHLFEEEMIREIREENGLDPVLARILDERFAGKITDPFLKQRLGKEIGLLKDPIAAMEAYDNVSLRAIHYAPLLNKINAYMADLNTPEGSREYLRNYARRMTGELSKADIALNKMTEEFANAIRGAPVFGERLYPYLTTGNPAGMAAYNLTSGLYMLWLGYKPTSAIRNLSQHTLILAEVGPVHFANGLRMRLTAEGKAALAESLVLRSRKMAFLPGIDSSFEARWSAKFRETSLYMFRLADKQNVSDAFLAGYSEAKALLPEADRQVWIDRGDEVAADTQYQYTKMNSMAFAQNAPGRTLSMLTTWSENWLELMSKWIKRTPSQVYLEYERQTGKKVVGAAWSQSYKAILLYMLIVGLGFAVKERTRLKAWEYTGITSVRYLADIMGGDFPALQAPGGAANTVVGFLTGDERRLNEGLYSLRTTFTPAVLRQLDSIAAGDKDWLTFFFYVEGRNIEMKRLKEKWEKDWKEYPIFEDAEARREFISKNKDYSGLTDAKMRNKWREENPLLEAQMFVVGQFTTLSSDEARTEALRLIEEHRLDTDLIDGYEKVFGVDTKAELKPFEDRLGNLEKLVIGEEAKYFTMGNYVSEINALVKTVGRYKVQAEGSPLTRGILEAQDTFEAYEAIKEGDARTLWRQQFPEAEAWMYLLGNVQSFKNPKSASILLKLMKKYDIPPEAIQAFIEDPERYDELFTPIFELKQKTFDLDIQYENYGNTESPIYIEDDEARAEARDKLRADNPEWVANLRRIEAYESAASEDIVEKWVDRGKTIDEFEAGSSEAILWLVDNSDVYDWAVENELLEDNREENRAREPVLRINVDYAKDDDWYNDGIPDKHKGIENRAKRDAAIAKERAEYLADNTEYNKARYRRDAYGLKDKDFNPFPDELVETYVGYYTLPKKPDEVAGIEWPEGVSYYADEWFLQDNPEFHQALVDFGRFKELKDVSESKVPTREIFKKWWIYNTLTTQYHRDEYRLDNPDLDEWGVNVAKPQKWTRTMSEQRRRARITPSERFLEDVAEREKAFRELMEELGIGLK